MRTIEIKMKKSELAEIVYGDNSVYDDWSIKNINLDLKQKVKSLESIYEKIDNEELDQITVEELYALGDAINVLSRLRYRGENEWKKNTM